MARLVRTKVEWEGINHEQLSIVEGDEPPLWPAEAHLEVIGKAQPRIDGAQRVTGRAVYTHDVQLPGMLYARVLRSPHPHARVRRVDTGRASRLSGVRAILSSANTPPISWMGMALFDSVVRFVGDDVAAVAADSDEVARDAVGIIDVDYEVLPFAIDAGQALAPGAPEIHPGGNVVGGGGRQYNRGDVKHGFSQSDVIVEETFQTQSALHNCMETHGAVACWDGDELTVWESTQSIFRVKEDLAAVFRLPLNKVRVICEYMGGGFGSKQYTGKWSIIAALLARQARRPVKLVMDRREESLVTGNRAPTTQHLRMGARRDGVLTAMELSAVSAIGAYGRMSLSIEGPALVMYACPNIHTDVRSVYTNTGPSRSFRGPGYVEGAFPLESMIDELAERLGIDPLEMRMKNYARTDLWTGRAYSAKHLDECYRTGADMIGWHAGRQTAGGDGVRRRGLGMASQTWGGGGGPPAYAWVRMNQDGTVEVITGSQDIGTGTSTVFAQIAAEELGMRPSEVKVRIGDTAIGPYDPVSWGSMTVSSVGPAVRQAAIDARNQLREVISGYLDVPLNQLEIRGGNVYRKGKKSALKKVSEVAAEVGNFTILGRGARGPNRPDVEVRTFGAQFAEVEVNTLTAEVKVVKVVTVHDVGRVMNPAGAANQCEGAVVQGIGYALTEGRVIDRRTGIVLNPDLEDYLLPTALDFGEVGYGFVDRPDNQANSLGAKGLGEPALIPTAPAIANAIRHAVGVRLLSLPMTRRKMIEALRNTGTAGQGR